MMTRTNSVMIAAALTMVLPASAVSFDFYQLGSSNPAGEAEFLPTDGYVVTGGDRASSDVHFGLDGQGIFGGDLTFTVGSLTATVTGTYLGLEAAVVQDQTTGWSSTRGAGLGVYHDQKLDDPTLRSIDRSDDNITVGEVLTVSFSEPVRLSALSLRAEGHSGVFSASEVFLLDGVSTPLTSEIGGLDMIGTEFTFAYGGGFGGQLETSPQQFYLAAMTVSIPFTEPSTVPDGGATLVLFGLSLLGLGGLRKRLLGVATSASADS